MISAGNDIVSLSAVDQQRTNKFRFYSRILTASEQVSYQHLKELPFELYVWLLWSVKEAAFKYLKRQQEQLLFSPLKINIDGVKLPYNFSKKDVDNANWQYTGNNENLFSGELIYGSYTLYFRSKLTGQWIASVVNDADNFEDIAWEVRSIENDTYEYQSTAARSYLINHLSSHLSGNLHIEKSAVGYPVLFKDNAKTDVPISLAHHACFVSYAYHLHGCRLQVSA